MTSLRELLLLIRFGQAKLSVSYHLADINRAKRGLARAYNAYDAAVAELNLHDAHQQQHRDPPRFLLKDSAR